MLGQDNRRRIGRGSGRSFGRFNYRDQHSKSNISTTSSGLPILKWNVERSMSNYAQFHESISTHLISKFGNHGRFIKLNKYYEAPEIEEPRDELDKDNATSVREWSTYKQRIKLSVEDDEKGRNDRPNMYGII